MPTTLELGDADYNYMFWVAMFAPAKAPREVIARLHAEAARAMQNASVKECLAMSPAEPRSRSTPSW